MHHTITTQRLTLIAATAEELRAAARKPKKLPQIMGKCTPLNDDLRYYRNKGGIYDAKADLLDIYPEEWLLCTAWQLCLDGMLIGECGFKGLPIEGMAEIGYALRVTYQGHGYMSEAVKALCRYAFVNDPRIDVIMAQTKRRNINSQNVLQGCGFVREDRRDWYTHWRLKRT
ncbi:MAG: GNAT family N-acetyltransferase [Oscillospiraceae bacterium]|nr:GNAT family N-acetyltransferase [Oscillospiraceae bacterium]